MKPLMWVAGFRHGLMLCPGWPEGPVGVRPAWWVGVSWTGIWETVFWVEGPMGLRPRRGNVWWSEGQEEGPVAWCVSEVGRGAGLAGEEAHRACDPWGCSDLILRVMRSHGGL